MSRNSTNRRILYISLAIGCIILFFVCIYFIFNPLQSSGNASESQRDFIMFTDVGQGDSAIIYSNGYSAVIDAGIPSVAPDICNDLSNLNISQIDVALISHLHSDHVGGLFQIAEGYKVKNLIMPELLNSSVAAAKNVKTFITNQGGAYYNAVPGMNFRIGEFEITVLGYMNDGKNENNRSVFTMAEIEGYKFLFTGDAEAEAERYLLDQNINIDCDVLKVSHHGSNTSTSTEFLNAATPEYAVISVGEDNMYNHPNFETISALDRINAKVYRTDKDGDITFDLSGDNIKIETEKQPS